GITEAEREAFELLPDDERQCDKCKTTCFLSALACSNCPERLAQVLVNNKDWRKESPPPEQLQSLLEQGGKLPVVVPECGSLQGLKAQGHWLEEVRRTLGTGGGERHEGLLFCSSRQKHPLSTLEAIVNEAQLIPVKLPNIESLRGCLTRARAWVTDLEEIQVLAFKEGEHQEKEALLRLQKANMCKSGLNTASCKDNGWWDETMDKDTSCCSENSVKENINGSHIGTAPLQSVCVCAGPSRAPQLRCYLCKDWFHGGCVSFPSLLPPSNPQSNHLCWWDWDTRFLCPQCQRSRRPRLATILALLVALQRLPVRLPEGEALQCLTERAITWQGRAKEALEMPELQQALQELQELAEKEQQKEEDAGGNSVIVLSDSEGGEGEDGVIDLTEDNSPIKKTKELSASQAECQNGVSKKSNVTGVESLMPLLPLLKGRVVKLSPTTREQLEELQLEGDLLEVTLDQTYTIHRVLQAASDPPKETLQTLIQVRLEHMVEPFGKTKQKRPLLCLIRR
ncbi:hypothetical protein GOODEAATRI_004874, partial [Goodea atripinnis]